MGYSRIEALILRHCRFCVWLLDGRDGGYSPTLNTDGNIAGGERALSRYVL